MKRKGFLKTILGAFATTKTVDFTKTPSSSKELDEKNESFRRLNSIPDDLHNHLVNQNVCIGYEPRLHIES